MDEPAERHGFPPPPHVTASRRLPDALLTRSKTDRTLARLCQTRRQLVDQQTRLNQQLNDHLKGYFPLIFELKTNRSINRLMLEVLRRWPDPRQLQRADRRILHRVLKDHGHPSEESRRKIIQRIRSARLLTRDRALIEPAAVMVQTLAGMIPVLQNAIAELEEKIETEMRAHPDAALFTALPGAGKSLAPRLLTAFGSQRDRYASAEALATFSGIAPVTKQSGKSRVVHRRYACPKFLRQTFHEFADSEKPIKNPRKNKMPLLKILRCLRDWNKNRTKSLGIDMYKMNTPLLPPFFPSRLCCSISFATCDMLKHNLHGSSRISTESERT